MIVGLDTSTRRRVVAVLTSLEGELVDCVRLDGVAVSSALGEALGRLLVDGVEAVVVAVGPGSYTGVRTGMAAALGVAHARGVPLFGIGSLDIAAAGAPGTARRIRAVSDAGRGGVFVADYLRDASGRPGATASARRIDASLLKDDGVDVIASCDDFGDRGDIYRVDPCRGLAAVVPVALTGEPLDPAHLAAVYVTAPASGSTW